MSGDNEAQNVPSNGVHTDSQSEAPREERPILVAILAKDKARFLPLYLRSLEEQTVDKARIIVYIRSNNNNDATLAILQNWADRVRPLYREVIEEYEDVPERVERFGEHEWNAERFKVLAKIRQRSLDLAKEREAHYFTADCDNFILPRTLECLLAVIGQREVVVAPLLHTDPNHKQWVYSNYHHEIDGNGYYAHSWQAYSILARMCPGLHECKVVHCTYLIHHNVLAKMGYADGTADYEYVIFSRLCRKHRVPQLIDNRHVYGWLTRAESDSEFKGEKWFDMFRELRRKQLAS